MTETSIHTIEPHQKVYRAREFRPPARQSGGFQKPLDQDHELRDCAAIRYSSIRDYDELDDDQSETGSIKPPGSFPGLGCRNKGVPVCDHVLQHDDLARRVAFRVKCSSPKREPLDDHMTVTAQ
jgi:hypothetical protein